MILNCETIFGVQINIKLQQKSALHFFVILAFVSQSFPGYSQSPSIERGVDQMKHMVPSIKVIFRTLIRTKPGRSVGTIELKMIGFE
jgi:hypothetical protein